MDALLLPWLARADTLLLPTWRTRLCDNLVITIPTPDDSKEAAHYELLRETLALFALALRVDARQFQALVLSGGKETPVDRFRAPLEKLRLCVQVDAVEDDACSTGLFQAWNEETASDEFTSTKKQLQGLGREVSRENPIKLHVQVRLFRSCGGAQRLKLDSVVAFLKSVDRRAFDVTQLQLVIATAYLDPQGLAALFETVEEFTDTANIVIALDLTQPCDQHVRLADWKAVFDVATRRQQTPAAARTHAWEIDVVASGGMQCEPTKDDARVRVVAACLSALAHADHHVTSITLRNLLEDLNERDCYKPTERRTRAKWLGYFLRVGRVKNVTISDTTLTQDDLDMIASTLQARSDQACLGALWNESWHEEKVMDLSTHDKVSPVVIQPEDFVGVMQDVDGNNHLVDVLVAGYGQWTVPRSSLASFPDKAEHHTSSSGLNSLTVRLSEGDGTEGHLLRLVMIAGKDLEELVIDATHSQIALSVLIIIFASCSHLKRLEVHTIYLTTGDDEQMYLPTHWANHPLEDLSVNIHLNEASIGLCGLASMLVSFGVQLKTLRIRAEPPMTTNGTARAAMETMLRTCGTSLQRLEVLGLSAEYFQGIFAPDALGLEHLESLVLTDVASDRSVWENLTTALAAPTHPLTLSLHTLRFHVRTLPEIHQMVATMLQANDKLVRCELELPSQMQISLEALGATQSRSLRRRKAPLTQRQKTAFLSSVQQSVLPWEASVLDQIFQFAAPTETRCVVVSTY